MCHRLALMLMILVFLTSCAQNSGIVTVGPDTFMVSRQAATGFTGMGTLKAQALEEARRFCSSSKKEVQVVNTTDSQPPYILGNFPRTEVQFMCLSTGDPELTRPKLGSRPDVVIENRLPSTGGSPPAGPEVEISSVSIESQPSDADVFIDGAFVGNTPLPNYGLSAGDHEIEVSKSGFKKWTRRLRISPGVPTRLNASLERLD